MRATKFNILAAPFNSIRDQSNYQNIYRLETMLFVFYMNGCYKKQDSLEYFYHQVSIQVYKKLVTLCLTFLKICSSIIHFTINKQTKQKNFIPIQC